MRYSRKDNLHAGRQIEHVGGKNINVIFNNFLWDSTEDAKHQSQDTGQSVVKRTQVETVSSIEAQFISDSAYHSFSSTLKAIQLVKMCL